jgi:phosphoglycolate phosphatase
MNAIIFDLDGTLLNTLADIGESMNRVLNQMGFPQHSIEAYKEFVGSGMDMLVYRALPSGYREDNYLLQAAERMNVVYSGHWADSTEPFDGIKDCLENIKKTNCKLYVLSNKTDNLTKSMVQYYFGDSTFTDVVGAGRFPKKPDPASTNYLIDSSGISKEDFVFVGDSGIDMKTARNAGIFSVGVLWGYRSKQELLENGAREIVSSPDHLLKKIFPSSAVF